MRLFRLETGVWGEVVVEIASGGEKDEVNMPALCPGAVW